MAIHHMPMNRMNRHADPYEVDPRRLYWALNDKRRAFGLSWRELGRRWGVASSVFTRMAQGHKPDADLFATAVVWLGGEVYEFVVQKVAD